MKLVVKTDNDHVNLRKIRANISRACASGGVDGQATIHLVTAAEEVFTNIARHAYRNGPGRVEIGVVLKNRQIRVNFKDWGAPFEPAQVKKRTLEELIDNKIEGGLGMMMLERLVDKVLFRQFRNHNETVLVKNWNKSKKSKGGRSRRS